MKLNRHIVLGVLVAVPAIMQPKVKAEDNKPQPIVTLNTHKVTFDKEKFYRTGSPVPAYETKQCTYGKYGTDCYNVSRPVEMHSYYQYGEVIKPKYTNVSQIIKTKKTTKNQKHLIKPITIKMASPHNARSLYPDIDSQYYTGTDDIRPNYTNVSQIQTKKK